MRAKKLESRSLPKSGIMPHPKSPIGRSCRPSLQEAAKGLPVPKRRPARPIQSTQPYSPKFYPKLFKKLDPQVPSNLTWV